MPIRPFTAAAPEAVFAFLDDARVRRDRRHWQWKYRLDAAGDGPHAYYWEEADGRVNGFIGLLPTTLHAGAAGHPAAWFVDWRAAGAQAVGAGIGLLRAAERRAGTLLTLQGSADTQRILPPLGWQRDDTPRTWLRPLTARFVAGLARRRSRLLAPLAPLAAATWWRLPVRPATGVGFVVVDRFAADHDAAWLARSREFPALLRRDSAYLNHFCADFPDGGYRLEAIRRGETAVGHLVTRCDRDARGMNRGRIVDVLWPRGDAPLLAATLAHACAGLAAAGADYVECLASVPDLQEALAALRFVGRGPVPVWYRRLPEGVPPPSAWHVTLLDCDRAWR